jgi:hypothetical protein
MRGGAKLKVGPGGRGEQREDRPSARSTAMTNALPQQTTVAVNPVASLRLLLLLLHVLFYDYYYHYYYDYYY